MNRQLPIAALILLGVAGPPSFAQQNATAAAPAEEGAPLAPPVPLLYREDWTRTPHQHPVSQADLANQSLDLKLYGPSGKEILTASAGAASMNGGSPPHVWTGLCLQTCAAALRDKNNFIDLSGLGKIRWDVKISGLHRIHLIVKLADGTWLLDEHEDSNMADFHPSEFTPAESRWIKLDINKVVTRGNWLQPSSVDLTKVDEIGFTDLMPGSGHGDGGFTDMGWIEVYGKPVPRSGH